MSISTIPPAAAIGVPRMINDSPAESEMLLGGMSARRSNGNVISGTLRTAYGGDSYLRLVCPPLWTDGT
jgi:hypothetical protein